LCLMNLPIACLAVVDALNCHLCTSGSASSSFPFFSSSLSSSCP
jgi:hypothetical protein